MDVFYWKTSIIFKTPTKHLNYHGVKHATSKSETRVKPQKQAGPPQLVLPQTLRAQISLVFGLPLAYILCNAMMIILLFLKMEAFELGKLRGRGASGPKWGRGVVWGL